MAEYPPRTFERCLSIPCRSCCSHGHRYEWPELIGKNGQHAQAIIEKDNPYVAVVIVTEHHGVTMDFCCNRVFLGLDHNGNVRVVPRVG